MRFSAALSFLVAASAAQYGTAAFTNPSVTHRAHGETAFVSGVTQRPAVTMLTKQDVRRTALFGILDEINSDSYDLLGSSSKSKDSDAGLINAYEIFLADLVFSTNDPRVDIMNRYELASDPQFLSWLGTKIEKSRDPDERVALKDLLEMINDITTRIEVNRLAEERAMKEAEEAERARIEEAESVADDGRAMSTADILRKARAINTAAKEEDVKVEKPKKSFYEENLTPEIRLSYEGLLKKVLPPYKAGDSPASVVFNYYDQFDAQFVKVLDERAVNGDDDSKNVLEALAVEQQKRIAVATETLKTVLSLGEPMRMEGAIVRLAREGKIDEPFLLLVEANENQARSAGAAGPAQLMARLKKRAIEEKDKQATTKEVRLIRKLLRTEDPNEREKILADAFTPKDELIVPGTAENARRAADGDVADQKQAQPEVAPPDFINACKAVLLNFGNLDMGDDRGDLASRIKKIASEAEVVATRIYGQGMSLKEQQDRMWKEQTTSIFDLERMEIEAERMGEVAPWTNPNASDEMLIPGFDAQGRMQIGGS